MPKREKNIVAKGEIACFEASGSVFMRERVKMLTRSSPFFPNFSVASSQSGNLLILDLKINDNTTIEMLLSKFIQGSR